MSYYSLISYTKSIIKYFYKINNTSYLLGRWCHLNVPNCNERVIMRKIDFANSDNNFICNISQAKKKYDDKLKPQDYIDAMF